MERYPYIKLICLIILSWISIPVAGTAQEGNPFMTHFKLPDGAGKHNWGFEQDENGLMFILNQRGIFIFDGLQWENLAVSGRPVSMAYSNRLFYCTDKGVGYILRNEKGIYEQNLVIGSDEINPFHELVRTGEGVFAISPRTICLISNDDELKIDTIYHASDPRVFISGFFVLGNQMYYINNFTDINRYTKDGSSEKIESLSAGENFTFSFKHGNQIFLGSSANKLYRFDGRRLSPFHLQQGDYFRTSLLGGGISLGPEKFALSTINGGCMVINASDGSTLNVLNYFHGLPDDEIHSLGLDNEGGLWISHGMGITRADLSLPVRSFGFYPGLSGNLLSALEFSGILYVGTSEGLYYLDEEREYRRIVITVEPEIIPGEAEHEKPDEQKEEAKPVADDKEQQEGRAAPAGDKQPGEETVEQRRGFLSRFINRLAQRDDETDDREPAEEEPHEVPADRNRIEIQPPAFPDEKKAVPERRVVHQLQSVSHTYKPVSGIRGKVLHLAGHGGSLYAATNLGLFQVTNGSATSILRGKNILFMEGSGIRNDALLIGTDEGAYIVTRKGRMWSVEPLLDSYNQLVVSMAEIDGEHFLVTTEFEIILLKRNEDNYFDSRIIPSPGREFSVPVVRRINGEIRIFSSDSVFVFNPENEQLIADSTFIKEGVSAIAFYQSDFTWIKTGTQWISFTSGPDPAPAETNLINILDNPNSIFVSDRGEIYAVTGFDHLYRISAVSGDESGRELGIYLKGVRGLSGNLLDPGDIRLEYANNTLKIDISAPFYIKEGSVVFQYYISGLTERWSEWSGDPVLEFPYLPQGNYTLNIRAKDILGNISGSLDIPLLVKPPFWQTGWFLIVFSIIVILLFILIIIVRERNLKLDKEVLEQKVGERTRTIEDQKEVLEQQRDNLEKYNREIVKQKEEIEKQRDKIFKQNLEITKSIIYARRIQSAVMPSKKILKDMLKDYFLILRPRDIVSGDFYWMTRKNGKVILVASDCTGHGIPGALMSMMGVSLLNDIVNVAGITRPDLILNNLRHKIKSTLSQTGKEDEATDGMDIAVCVFDLKGNNLQFAGAYIPLFLVRDGELTEYKPDKMPVGIHISEKETFTLNEIRLMSGDKFYLFSDGYVDQFGGPFGKKFKKRSLRELLMRINAKPMDQQKKEIEDTLDLWQAAQEQVDDILVIGFCLI